MKRCWKVIAHERIGGIDEPFVPVTCLLPEGHDGPHSDWSAWFGVTDPDFARPGMSIHDAVTPA